MCVVTCPGCVGASLGNCWERLQFPKMKIRILTYSEGLLERFMQALFETKTLFFPTERFLSAELVESEKLLGATDAL